MKRDGWSWACIYQQRLGVKTDAPFLPHLTDGWAGAWVVYDRKTVRLLFSMEVSSL